MAASRPCDDRIIREAVQTTQVLDWLNLLAGAVLGVLLGLVPGWFDKRRARSQELSDARHEWSVAAGRLELIARPDTTSAEFHYACTAYPIDRWRKLLGPSDFLLVERLQSAYTMVEVCAAGATEEPKDESATRRLDSALLERQSAFVEFANMARALQSSIYNEVVSAEMRRQLRSDYLNHPIRTIRRERRMRKLRREARTLPHAPNPSR